MIPSTSPKIDSTTATDAVRSQTARSSKKSPTIGTDQFSSDKTQELIQILATNPTVRPEVVSKAKSLASDPAYPPVEVVRKISDLILAAKDPAETVN